MNSSKKEDIMTVKILIERELKENPTWEDLITIKELRIGAMQRNGYVSGETLVDTEDQRKILILSVWANKAGWDEWVNSDERRNLEAKLENKLKHSPSIRSFMSSTDLSIWSPLS
jgi:heme-degrading monooxygenase HmoA